MTSECRVGPGLVMLMFGQAWQKFPSVSTSTPANGEIVGNWVGNFKTTHWTQEKHPYISYPYQPTNIQHQAHHIVYSTNFKMSKTSLALRRHAPPPRATIVQISASKWPHWLPQLPHWLPQPPLPFHCPPQSIECSRVDLIPWQEIPGMLIAQVMNRGLASLAIQIWKPSCQILKKYAHICALGRVFALQVASTNSKLQGACAHTHTHINHQTVDGSMHNKSGKSPWKCIYSKLHEVWAKCKR